MMSPCEQIAEQVGEMFQCEEHNNYVRIRTPFLYPDGDIVDLFLRDDGGHSTLTDLGETIRWLRNQMAGSCRTKKQTHLIEDICQTNGLAFFRGRLEVRLNNVDIGEAAMRLGQGCVQVADVWFTFKNRVFHSVADEIGEYLTENNVEYGIREKHPGRSGRMWPVDFHTSTSRGYSYIQVLSTGTRGATHRMSEHVLAMWHDLSHLATGTESAQFVSLFDDTVDIWRPEDFALLDDSSVVAYWSRPDELLAAIVS